MHIFSQLGKEGGEDCPGEQTRENHSGRILDAVWGRVAQRRQRTTKCETGRKTRRRGRVRQFAPRFTHCEKKITSQFVEGAMKYKNEKKASESRGIVTADGCLFCTVNFTSLESYRMFPSFPAFPFPLRKKREKTKRKKQIKR